MVEVKYDKPIEYYTVDNFIEECCKLVGKPVHGVMDTPTFDKAFVDYMTSYSLVLGNNDPLYTDLSHAVYTRYNTLIASPTFLTVFKYPISHGALFDGPYPLAGFEAAFDWEWNDVVKMNDRFTTEHILKDVYEKPSEKGRVVYLVSECKYWNALSKELVATCLGTYAAIARAESITEIPEAITEGFKNYPITDRKVYCYSEEEIKHLLKDVDAEVRAGEETRYWEDVNVGDNLTPVVKGPVTTSALMQYAIIVFSSKLFPGFELQYLKGLKNPGFMRTNPLMGWPYDIQIGQHMDPNFSPAGGLPDAYALGTLRAGLSSHLLLNWMSEEGFLRRINVNVLEPFIYGDTMWISGKVVDKYKEKLGGALYGAVDIEMEAVNQLGQKIQPGTATVYLPFPGYPVKLPILD
jgi:hypothetical protein